MGRVSDARERLLESGAALMHERGYTAVGVGDLCAWAGVKKGSFYHFFPSKLDFALAVVDGFQAQAEELLGDLADGEGPPLERLYRYLESLGRHHERSRGECGKVLGCPLGNLALEMSTQEPALRERLRAALDRNVGVLAGVVDEAIERRELGRVDAGSTARAVLAQIEGRLMLAKMQNDLSLLRSLPADVSRLLGAAAA